MAVHCAQSTLAARPCLSLDHRPNCCSSSYRPGSPGDQAGRCNSICLYSSESSHGWPSVQPLQWGMGWVRCHSWLLAEFTVVAVPRPQSPNSPTNASGCIPSGALISDSLTISLAVNVTCVTSQYLLPPPPLYVTHRHNSVNPSPLGA